MGVDISIVSVGKAIPAKPDDTSLVYLFYLSYFLGRQRGQSAISSQQTFLHYTMYISKAKFAPLKPVCQSFMIKSELMEQCRM